MSFSSTAGAVVASVSFNAAPPTGSAGGAVHLQNVETITLEGGTVTNDLDAGGASASITFNLVSGIVDNIVGSDQNDLFIVSGDIMTDTDSGTDGLQAALAIGGVISGGPADEEGQDEVRLIGSSAVVRDILFSGFDAEDLSVRDVEIITIERRHSQWRDRRQRRHRRHNI